MITVDRDACKGCRYCILTCPKGVIAIDSAYNLQGYFPAHVVNPGKCNGCAMCAHMCPEVAIEVWREE